jgi:uncharacterized protein YjbJ (UPF0337 family)
MPPSRSKKSSTLGEKVKNLFAPGKDDAPQQDENTSQEHVQDDVVTSAAAELLRDDQAPIEALRASQKSTAAMPSTPRKSSASKAVGSAKKSASGAAKKATGSAKKATGSAKKAAGSAKKAAGSAKKSATGATKKATGSAKKAAGSAKKTTAKKAGAAKKTTAKKAGTAKKAATRA